MAHRVSQFGEPLSTRVHDPGMRRCRGPLPVGHVAPGRDVHPVDGRSWCISLRPNSCADAHAPVFSRRCTAAEWVSVEPCAAALSRRTWHACRRCTRRGGAACTADAPQQRAASDEQPAKPQIYVLHCVPNLLHFRVQAFSTASGAREAATSCRLALRAPSIGSVRERNTGSPRFSR